jgi:uncharacterized protein YcsI (UPF0317 family)
MTLAFATLRDLIQQDVNNRGLRTDPASNLVNACPEDLEQACRSIAESESPAVAVLTGFFIPHADPPAGETDGPLGAIHLARTLAPVGIKVVLVSDPFCQVALEAGLAACGLRKLVPVVTLPDFDQALAMTSEVYWDYFAERAGRITHLVALERVGPSHTPESVQSQAGVTAEMVERFLREVPAEHHDRCHSMRGRDITRCISPAHRLIEAAARQEPRLTTIGIGDGGNEIGMGKLPWDVIRRNIPGGNVVACRVPTDWLIVCGVSNWGAYALGVGSRLALGRPIEPELFDPQVEESILEVMVRRGPLVDGVTAAQALTVDGLLFERYVEPLVRMGGKTESASRKAEQAVPLAAVAGLACSTPPPAAERGSLAHATGAAIRRLSASGQLDAPTAGMALGYVQANLVIVPRDLAFDFLLFCQRNPRPCPLLDVTDPGCPEPKLVAPGADLRTDLPRYCVYEHGHLVDEPTDLLRWWRDDLVSFVIGCSFTFERALLQAGLPLRHLDYGCNVPMYRTNLPCRPAGVFRGPTVVSMRPMTPAQAITATRICSRFPLAHGVPLHLGEPQAIGITDLSRPDFGDPVPVQPGELPVFWACGVTPQAVAMEARPPLLITHKPGHMFLTDWRDTDLES